MTAVKVSIHYRLIWVAIALSILFWVGDSILEGMFIEKTGYITELWPHEFKQHVSYTHLRAH